MEELKKVEIKYNSVLNFFDQCLYEFLKNNVRNMPKRFTKWIASYYPDANIRKLYLKDIGVVFGENSFVNIGFIKIPNTKSVNKVIIGNNVSIAPNVICVCESNANNSNILCQYNYIKNKAVCNGDIVIKDDTWIGANVTILPGVTIEKCVVIGAGSVVNKNCEAYGVYAGVPARKIKDIRKEEE